jgi:hypothetical protein
MAQTHHPASTTDADREAMTLTQISGILNPNMTLNKIMIVSTKLMEIHGKSGISGHATFIHPGYVYYST